MATIGEVGDRLPGALGVEVGRRRQRRARRIGGHEAGVGRLGGGQVDDDGGHAGRRDAGPPGEREIGAEARPASAGQRRGGARVEHPRRRQRHEQPVGRRRRRSPVKRADEVDRRGAVVLWTKTATRPAASTGVTTMLATVCPARSTLTLEASGRGAAGGPHGDEAGRRRLGGGDVQDGARRVGGGRTEVDDRGRAGGQRCAACGCRARASGRWHRAAPPSPWPPAARRRRRRPRDRWPTG